MTTKVCISFGKNGLGQFQACIEEVDPDGSSHGYRFAGGKYDGMGRELLKAELTPRDAREIRQYLDIIDPPTGGEGVEP